MRDVSNLSPDEREVFSVKYLTKAGPPKEEIVAAADMEGAIAKIRKLHGSEVHIQEVFDMTSVC